MVALCLSKTTTSCRPAKVSSTTGTRASSLKGHERAFPSSNKTPLEAGEVPLLESTELKTPDRVDSSRSSERPSGRSVRGGRFARFSKLVHAGGDLFQRLPLQWSLYSLAEHLGPIAARLHSPHQHVFTRDLGGNIENQRLALDLSRIHDRGLA